ATTRAASSCPPASSLHGVYPTTVHRMQRVATPSLLKGCSKSYPCTKNSGVVGSVPNQTLHRDRGRILVSRDTTPLQRPRRVNFCVRRKRRFVMSVFAALLVLASSADGERVIPSATVKGNIATRVVFKGASSDKVAASCLALLASCLYSHVAAEGPMPDWEDSYTKVFNTR